jgi:hypothetical protein
MFALIIFDFACVHDSEKKLILFSFILFDLYSFLHFVLSNGVSLIVRSSKSTLFDLNFATVELMIYLNCDLQLVIFICIIHFTEIHN